MTQEVLPVRDCWGHFYAKGKRDHVNANVRDIERSICKYKCARAATVYEVDVHVFSGKFAVWRVLSPATVVFCERSALQNCWHVWPASRAFHAAMSAITFQTQTAAIRDEVGLFENSRVHLK